MQFAAGTYGSDSLGSILIDPGVSDDTAFRPILTELNGMDVRAFIAMDSLQIQDTLGQPVTAAFTMIQPPMEPVVGDRLRIKYFAQVIFAGTIDHVTKTTTDLSTILYQIDCLDWSQILFRRKIRRTFSDLTIENILDSILASELANEGFTKGVIDSAVTLTLVDADAARVFDVCRDIAGATGQTFYVDFDQSLQMRSTSVIDAPFLFSEANVLIEGSSIQIDRETYRNVQIVIVKGTPPAADEPVIVVIQRRNEEQIAIRAAIEGGTGIYEDMESITHPTSNATTPLSLLGDGYAKLRLATSGTPRQIIRCQVRDYGFRGGQIATVDLPTFGVAGTYVIQRVSIREAAGQFLFHDLELTTSSLQQRAYEAWIGIVKGSKVTVQLPGTVLTNLQTFLTPGADTWTVPGGVTIAEFTCIGPGGGGGAGDTSRIFVPGFGCSPNAYHHGGLGGAGGRATRVEQVEPGQIWDVTVGAAGTGGTNGVTGSASCHTLIAPVSGTAGGSSKMALSTVVTCQGDPGQPGGNANLVQHGVTGANGGGLGDGVSVGGGATGGAGGNPPTSQPVSGQAGRVEVRW